MSEKTPTRIKYNKIKKNKWVTNPYIGGKEAYQGSIFKMKSGFYCRVACGIMNEDTKIEFVTKSLTYAKRKIKAALKSCGVIFLDEVRKNRFD